jgi:ribosomal protein S18 acetylase RimI-like enzyme
LSMSASYPRVEMRAVRPREHFLFNFLNFLYFRRTESDVRFLLENGPLSVFVVIPYVLFSEIYFFRQWRFFIVAKEGIAGLLALEEEDDEIYISSLAVSPAYRRMGIASYALSFSQNFARNTDKNAVELMVVKRNVPAIRLYLKHGFRLEKEMRRSLVLKKGVKAH